MHTMTVGTYVARRFLQATVDTSSSNARARYAVRRVDVLSERLGSVSTGVETPWWKLVLVTLLALTMLPALKSWDIRGLSETNSLNGVTWSLLYEYIANILYALFIRHFSKTVPMVFVAVSALLTLDLTLNLDLFGLLADRSGAANTVIGGWVIEPEQCYISVVRLLYPFFCGLLLSRMGRLIHVRGGFWCARCWCCHFIYAVHSRRRKRYMDMRQRHLQHRVHTVHLPVHRIDGSVMHGYGQPEHSRLQFFRKNFLSSLHHPPASDLSADGLVCTASRRSAELTHRHGRVALSARSGNSLRFSPRV